MHLYDPNIKTMIVFIGKEFVNKICRLCERKVDFEALYHEWLTKQSFGIKYKPLAEVAELADALRSGRSSH